MKIDSLGWNWRPASEVRLSPEAQKRIDDKIQAVQDARRKAMESWHTYIVG